MGVMIGSNVVKHINVGSNSVKYIYVGANLVYTRPIAAGIGTISGLETAAANNGTSSQLIAASLSTIGANHKLEAFDQGAMHVVQVSCISWMGTPYQLISYNPKTSSYSIVLKSINVSTDDNLYVYYVRSSSTFKLHMCTVLKFNFNYDNDNYTYSYVSQFTEQRK